MRLKPSRDHQPGKITLSEYQLIKKGGLRPSIFSYVEVITINIFKMKAENRLGGMTKRGRCLTVRVVQTIGTGQH